jgi:ATP-dependent exoDNAse (exonuclease V) beta subunit
VTSLPGLGQPAEDVKREDPGDLVLWSVTTIIGVLEKPALLYWAAEMAADAAIDNEATWKGMLEDRGREETVKWLRDARFRRPKNRLSSADLGTVFHSAAQEYALSGRRPSTDEIKALVQAKGGSKFSGIQAEADVIGQFLDRFDGWLQRFTPSYQATEVTVYHPDYGYAGTCDGFLTIDGTRFIIDYKTTREPLDSRGNPRTPYPEQVALQLALYRWAKFAAVWRPRRTEKYRRRYYLLSPLEREMAQPVPEVDSGLVIHVTPEACEAFPMRCDEEVHRAALNTQEAFRWVNHTSKAAMAPPLEVPQ